MKKQSLFEELKRMRKLAGLVESENTIYEKKYSDSASEFIGKEISHLMKDKGYSHERAVAAAINIAKEKGYKVPSNESKNLINEEIFSDLFNFLEKDPRKMSQGSVYYVADMNSSMNKFIVNDSGEKVPNPMYGKLFKHTRFMFKWENTYAKAMEKINPDHIMGKRSGTFEKIQGYDVLESGKSGLYLPIIPTGSEYNYVFIGDDGESKILDKEMVKKYLKPASPSQNNQNKSDFRLLIIDKIAKLTGGGNTWINPNFKGEYKGVGLI